MTPDHAGKPSKSVERHDDVGTSLPHERDQTVDAPPSDEPGPVEKKAFDDAASHKPDTSLAPVTDQVYRKLKGD